jgi:hypothetical protein
MNSTLGSMFRGDDPVGQLTKVSFPEIVELMLLKVSDVILNLDIPKISWHKNCKAKVVSTLVSYKHEKVEKRKMVLDEKWNLGPKGAFK